jgi:cholesterol oxidase
MEKKIYDYVVIGTGFGGSVSSMRLSQKGYKVLMLERGCHFRDDELPKTSWNLRDYLWLPALGCYGILQMSLSKGFFVYHGSGVGGGSLVYAAVLMQPRKEFFHAPAWEKFADWENVLKPHYQTARKMLGVAQNPRLWPADRALADVAKELDLEPTFRPTDVGVFFGEPEVSVPDPYFDGEGPERVGCNHCGACIVGCRLGAKNTLEKNYIFFAEKFGAEIRAGALVNSIRPVASPTDNGARYAVTYSPVNRPNFAEQIVYTKNVILSAGVLGTLSLLFHCRDEIKTLPDISHLLGEMVRTNSETFLGAFDPKQSELHSEGLSITSIFYANKNTQVEPVRFPAGSSTLLILLSSPLIENASGFLSHLMKTILEILRHPGQFINTKFVPGLSKRGVALMVMQTEDNHMKLRKGRNPFAGFRRGLIGEQDPLRSVPVNLELGHQVARMVADKLNGYASGSITEGLINVPMTAHILGGCNFGNSAEEGVIGLDFQVHNYPGLYVVDGSVVPANPGVNPSLTITALAEYAMGMVPDKVDE